MNESRPIPRELCEWMSERTEARLTKHGETIDELKECTVKLTQILEVHNEKLSDYGERLIHLERRPTRWVDRVAAALLSALAAALVSFLL